MLAVPAVEAARTLARVRVVVGVTGASIEAGVRVAGRGQRCGGKGGPGAGVAPRAGGCRARACQVTLTPGWNLGHLKCILPGLDHAGL